jgi:hypothetical protein
LVSNIHCLFAEEAGLDCERKKKDFTGSDDTASMIMGDYCEK